MSDKGYFVIGVPRQQNTDLLITAISGFITPVKGTITGVYGSQRILNGQPRSPHRGVDIAAARGTPVVSPFESRYYLLGASDQSIYPLTIDLASNTITSITTYRR